MLCPKCHLVSGERFCPQCGSDLQIYAELAALKDEVESLHKLVVAGVRPISEIAQEPTSAPEQGTLYTGKTPPPLPSPSVTQAEPNKSAQRGGLAEVAVGQKWLLGIG